MIPLCTDRIYNQITFWFRGGPFDFEGREGGLEEFIDKYFDMEYVENQYYYLEDGVK